MNIIIEIAEKIQVSIPVSEILGIVVKDALYNEGIHELELQCIGSRSFTLSKARPRSESREELMSLAGTMSLIAGIPITTSP